MKLAGTQPVPAEAPADTSLDFGGSEETPAPAMDEPAQPSEEPAPADDKPFDDTPFDAGVEADEESDPKKYIEQLTGKLGQSLRTYNEEQGQPDLELEKFAINSLLSATHTSEMDAEDQRDIIKKVKSAGDNDSEGGNEPSGDEEPTGGEEDLNFGDDDLEENILEEKEEGFLIKPKKLSIFAPEGSEEAKFKHKIVEKLHETFNQEDMNSEPMIAPVVKPTPEVAPSPEKVKPNIAPSRKNKPFLPMPNVQPDPKAIK